MSQKKQEKIEVRNFSASTTRFTLSRKESSFYTMARKICRFFSSPKGCIKTDCQFLHELDTQQSTSNQNSGQSTSRATNDNDSRRNRNFIRSARSSYQREPDSRKVPNGICRDWYYDKVCRKGFECKFSHSESLVKSETSENSPLNLTTTGSTSTSTVVVRNYGDLVNNNNTSSLLNESNVKERDKEGEFKRLFVKIESEEVRLLNCNQVYIFTKGLLSTTIESESWVRILFVFIEFTTPRYTNFYSFLIF